MVTARQEPRLVLVSITYENDCLTFSAPDVGQLILPTKLPSSNRLRDCRCLPGDMGETTTDLIFLEALPFRCYNLHSR